MQLEELCEKVKGIFGLPVTLKHVTATYKNVNVLTSTGISFWVCNISSKNCYDWKIEYPIENIPNMAYREIYELMEG